VLRHQLNVLHQRAHQSKKHGSTPPFHPLTHFANPSPANPAINLANPTPAHGAQSGRDGSAVDPIPITDQVARCLIPRKCLRDLACDPFRGRMRCDIDPDKVSAGQRSSVGSARAVPRRSSAGLQESGSPHLRVAN
jgi:hypothetical protein